MKQSNILSLKKLGAIVTGQEEVQGETISDVLNYMAENYQAPSGGADEALAEVEYQLSNGYTDYSYFFAYRNSAIRMSVELIRHTSNATNFSYMFMSSQFKEIPAIDTSSGTNFKCMYYNCGPLKSIKGVNLTNATNVTEMFRQIDYVEEIIFNGVIKITGLDLSYCSQLTHDSLMSAINALYDYASEGSTKTYKLIFGSTNRNKLTSEEQAIPLAKGWTLQ